MTKLRTIAAVLSTLALALFGVAPVGARGWILAVAAMSMVVGFIRPSSTVTPWCLFVAAMLAMKTFLPAFDVWPVHFLVPLVCVAVYSNVARGPDPSAAWARLGSFEPGIRVLTVIVTAVSVLGLVLWALVVRPRIPIPAGLDNRSPVVLAAVGCAFASLNAAMEELVFRGIALNALSAVFKSTWPAVVLQAAAFGTLHYASPSIPDGPEGVALTFIYGLLLGVLAVKSDGILAPWVAHFVADLIVFGVLVGWM